MNRSLLDNDKLDAYRKVGDKEADDAINNFIQKFGAVALREIMPYLSDFKHIKSINNKYSPILNFIESHSELPSWIDEKELIRSCDFYEKYMMEIGMVLSCYALPYCYLGAKGAQILVMTNRIKDDTLKRLKETGNFLQSILTYDNWKNGNAITSLNKTRLLHAAVRAFVHQHGKSYDIANGTPINQEDLIGTNLAFSLIVMRGLRKTGVMFDHYYERAYLHFWKVAGFFLGIHEELLVENMKEAMKLDQIIALRQFKKSKEGVELTHSLLKCFHSLTTSKLEDEMILAQTRFLLGNTYADMLKVPATKIPLSLLKTYNYSSSLVASIYKK